jgi:hypothetical protein
VHNLPQMTREITVLGAFPTSSVSSMTFHPATTSLTSISYVKDQILRRFHWIIRESIKNKNPPIIQ